MTMKPCKYILIAMVTFGLLFGAFSANLPCFAGGAMILVPAEDRDVPKGSHIPERRTQEVEKKIKKHKAMMKEKRIQQQQEQLPQDNLPKTKSPKE